MLAISYDYTYLNIKRYGGQRENQNEERLYNGQSREKMTIKILFHHKVHWKMLHMY